MRSLGLFMSCVAVSLACPPAATGPGGQTVSVNEKIARNAETEEQSHEWAFMAAHRYGLDTDKSNVFVAEMIEKAGGSVPHRYTYLWSPIGAAEWANPTSTVLENSTSWTNVELGERGDVAADGSQVGIVVSADETVRATTAEQKVVRSNWGFMADQNTTFWRYTGP